MKLGGKCFAAYALGVVIAVSMFIAPQPAKADYRFCNATSYVLQGAIGVAGASPALRGSDSDASPKPADHAELAGADTSTATIWHAEGWTQIMPGDCASVLKGPVSKGDYYVFARSIDAHQGPTKYFSGSARFCTLNENFSIEGRENCALRGYDSYDFIRVTVKAGETWTTTFGEPRDFDMDEARIAGAQRLLQDNGLHLPKIDGYAAKNTSRAVMAFQRASGASPTGTIDETLIEALVAGARKEQAKFGLTLCNKTKYLVWAAVGFGSSEEDMSSGWIRVPPESCAKAIKDKLGQGPYYVYAEATDDKGAIVTRGSRRFIWSGTQHLCVKTTRFEIKGREACAARGYDERAFMKVETDGKSGFSLPLE